jgi:hypothetical protein
MKARAGGRHRKCICAQILLVGATALRIRIGMYGTNFQTPKTRVYFFVLHHFWQLFLETDN